MSIFDWEKKVPPAVQPNLAQPEQSGAGNGNNEEKPRLHLQEDPSEKSPSGTPDPSQPKAADATEKRAWPPKVADIGDHQKAAPAAAQTAQKKVREARPAVKKAPAKKAASKSKAKAKSGSPEGKKRRRKKPESTPEQKADEAHILSRLLERVKAAKKEKFQQLAFTVEGGQLIVEIGVNGKVDETTSEVIRKNLRRVIGKEGLELDGTIYSTSDVTIRFFEGFHQPEFDAEARSDTEAKEGTELHHKLSQLSELLGTPEDERLIWTNVEMLDDGEEMFVNVDDRTITPEDDNGQQIIALVTEIVKLESRLKLSAVNQNEAGERAALVQSSDGDFVIRTSQALTTTAEHDEERLRRGELRREVREASLGNIRRHVDQLFDALKADEFAANDDPAIQEMAKLFVSKAEEYSARSRAERQSDNRIRDLLTAAIGTSGSEAEKQVRQIYDVITKPEMRFSALSQDGKELTINRGMLVVHLRTYLRYREIHDQWSQRYGDKTGKRPARVATLPAFHKEIERFEREDSAYVEGATIPDPPPQMPYNMNLVVAMASRLGLKHGDWKVPKLQPPKQSKPAVEETTSENTEAQKLLEQKVNAYSLLVENFEMHLAAMLDQEGPFSEAQKDILETIVNSAPILIVPEKIEDDLGLPTGSSEELADLDMRLQDLATRSEQLLTDPRMNSMQSYSELLRELAKRADEVAEAEKDLSETGAELKQVVEERDALSVERNTAVARNVYNEKQQEDDNEEVARVLHDLMQTGKNQEITIKNRDARIEHLEGRESDLEAEVRRLEQVEAQHRLAEIEIQTLKEQLAAGASDAEVVAQENDAHDSHRQEELETNAMYFEKVREELDKALQENTIISNERDDYRQRLESLLSALGGVKPEEIPGILASNKSFQTVFPNVITVLESPRADELLPELVELIREVLASSK